MKKAVVIYTVVLLSFVISSPIVANYDKGLTAFKKYDFKTAYSEWKKLAEKGDPQVQSTIAVMYHTGTGVKKNYEKAFYWYQKAALQGVTSAQANLGVMYAKGTGTKRDFVQSYAWYSVAASALAVEKMGSALWGIDYLATQMSPAQLKKAKKLSAEYEKKYLKSKK
ncbi:MAG: sel1 repeat family protein [Gammaproteobacteria bacterium]|nr:sel1 repeat family protein [Gammaproteobacteria bacterium]MDH5800251.1 sel1 repeat family protein [Gammaproteobacteria bacterium]